MRKQFLKIVSLFFSAILLFGFAGCVPNGDTRPPVSDPPEVVIGADGLAVWNKIDGALYYLYILGDGQEETPTVACELQLEEGQSIRVKAVSANEAYRDSDYSAPQTYHKGEIAPHDHSDVNEDGVCDRCRESVLVELSILAVNDLHGKFMDSGNQPGVDEFTTYLKNLYADPAQEEILLSSGDMWQGTAESAGTKGQLMTDWMNEVGFVSMTLGNHEFDWGSAVLSPNSEQANFPLLGINVFENGARPDYCEPSVVVERTGIKVGIIGAIGDCLSSISGEFQQGLDFMTGSSLTRLVENEATRLREEEGCDFIVYSIHDGGDAFASSDISDVTDSDMAWYDSSLSNGYVDLVFEAHTHRKYIVRDEYGVYHLQGGGENSGVSRANVTFNTVTKKSTVEPRILSASTYASDSLADDPFVQETYREYFSDPDKDPYAKVLGYNAQQRSSTDIVNMTAQLYYEFGVKTWEEEYDEYEIVCGGGFLKARSPYNLARGDVTYSQLYSLMPFDNDIVLCRVTGSNLKSIFLSNKSSSYHSYPTISSSAVQNSAVYYVVTDTYTSFSSYNRNKLTEVARIKGTYARDLLADYIQAGNWA